QNKGTKRLGASLHRLLDRTYRPVRTPTINTSRINGRFFQNRQVEECCQQSCRSRAACARLPKAQNPAKSQQNSRMAVQGPIGFVSAFIMASEDPLSSHHSPKFARYTLQDTPLSD